MTERRESRWAVPLVVAYSIASISCYSEIPLDSTPRLRVAADLLGQWDCPSDGAEAGAVLTVRASDDRRYAFTWQEPRHDIEHYEAYASKLGSLTLVNVAAVPREDSGWPHPWAFVTASFSSGVLTIRLAGEHVVTGKERSSEEVRAALAGATSRPDFLGKPIVCKRPKRT